MFGSEQDQIEFSFSFFLTWEQEKMHDISRNPRQRNVLPAEQDKSM